jgi:ATP-dependent Clp protease ATP-binding subunit ClpA
MAFELFDAAARQVVVLAQEEARRLRAQAIGAEHLLLGVVRTDPALLEVSVDRLRAEFAERGQPESSPGGTAV